MKMGCVSSKAHLNDTAPNVFEVTNVDEMGHLVSPGQLELTSQDLILHQRGKSVTKWPLRSLRKYGFDSEIFSFECGRRCPTGPGIYAFRCRRAEQLFNLLQQNIQIRNINEETNYQPPRPVYINVNSSNNVDAATAGAVHRRLPSQTQPEGYLNPTPVVGAAVRPHPSLSRPGSLNSNGPNSPVTPPVLSPPPDVLEHNNNKESNLVSLAEHSYTNARALEEVEQAVSTYINCPVPPSTEPYVNIVPDGHLYMNVEVNPATNNAKDLPNILPASLDPEKPDGEETRHCYANIDVEVGSLRTANLNLPVVEVPETPKYPIEDLNREVNYIELDLVPSAKGEHANLQVTPDSPNKPNKSYVTIDFKKTNALSQSVNPSKEVEEGSRKTRHNSTISDITTRHSNSLSD